jgi:signal transduction histidine kinase/ligand-binding sensor domain-containing protein
MPKKRFCLTYTFLFFCANTICAQKFPFRLFNTSNGLINNRCGNISQDSAGYIWIGTDNGITNYDGRKFNFFPGVNATYYFAHSFPNMYKGKVILGSRNQGIAVCYKDKVDFINLKSKMPAIINSALAINDTTFLVAKIGANGLCKWQGGKEYVIPIPLQDSIKQNLILIEDKEKNIWLGTDYGLIVFVKGNLQKPVLIKEFVGKYINVLKKDAADNIYIASRGDIFTIASTALRHIETPVVRPFFNIKDEIISIGFTSNGNVLVGSFLNNITVFNNLLKVQRTINSSNGLLNVAWDIFKDRENNIWVATEDGVNRVNSFDFIFFPFNLSGYPNIKSGTFYNNDFLFSNGLDYFKIENEKLITLNAKRDAPGYLEQRIIVTPDNKILVSNYGKIDNAFAPEYTTDEHKLSNNTLQPIAAITSKYNGPKGIYMNHTSVNSMGKLFFLDVNKQPWVYQAGTMLPCFITDEKPRTNFNSIAATCNDNEVVLTVNSMGILHFKLEYKVNHFALKLISKCQVFDSISEALTAKMMVDSKCNVWLPTKNKGLYLFAKKNEQYQLAKIFRADLLSSTFVTEVMEDSKGAIWVGTNKGIDKLTLQNDGSYTIQNDLYGNILTGKYIYFLKEKNRQLYIGTTGSLALVNLDVPVAMQSPQVFINHIAVNNKNADSLLANKTVHFGPQDNNISFEFICPSFLNENKTAYQYQLEGIDKKWSMANTSYSVTYNQLKPGSYTFKVRAQNANGIWTKDAAAFSFVIAKHFYQRWWFYFLCTLFLATILYWLYKLKIARIMAVQNTRNSISKDLHDDIGTTLSSITLMNAVMKNKIRNKPYEAIEMAEKIETTSREMIQNMSDIVWSINPGNDTIEKLATRLQQFSADVFEDSDTLHKLIIDDDLLKKPIAMDLRRDIYLICKEIISNTSKYAKAAKFEMHLLLEKNYVKIIANDNGIGFNRAEVKKGNGLYNIAQRIARHNGKYTLNADKNTGTIWKITMPL